MLIDFTLTNFRSFKDPVTLSLVATNAGGAERSLPLTGTKRGLKCAALCGTNGVGKSNVLAGLLRMQQMVVTPTEEITDDLPFEPFQLDAGSSQRTTTFAVTFKRAGIAYRYAFSYNATRVLDESLQATIPGGNSEVLFSREGGQIVQVPVGQHVAIDNTRPNALLLFALQNWNYAPAIEVFRWFSDDLVSLDGQPRVVGQLNEDVVAQLTQFLHAVGCEVAGVTQHQVAVQFLDGSRYDRPDLYLRYEKYDAAGEVVDVVELPLSRVSVGTQQLVAVGLALIQAQSAAHSQTLLADEFASALHPEVVLALLALVNSTAMHSQFILVTPQFGLLGGQLRPDQLYLVTKNYRGESHLTQQLAPEMAARQVAMQAQPNVDMSILRATFTR
ncbi:ATP/GTP-binding protein [Levilactobacillus yonginensis]|uniref:AAA family ATPase n=1 Tax=Levilactobacillus yonginensis TaxID=1054041 RepID=UPI00345DDF35